MATLRRIDGAFVLDWRDAEGERHRDTLGRVGELPEREAQRILKQRNLELSAGYRILNPNQAPFFSDFATDYLVWHAAEYPASHARVAQIVEDYLLPDFGHSRIGSLTPRQAEHWKQKRGREAKSQTVTKELRTLKAMVNKAVEWDVIPRNPIAKVAAPRSLDSKPPAFYTKDEMKALYAACSLEVNSGEGPQPNPLHAHMWRLYANTGMRRTEGMILKRSWVGQDAMKILSTDEDRTKSGKWREIPLTSGARMALDALPRDAYVLPRMTLPSLSRACIRDSRRAELTGGLHTLRHTYISHLVMAGVPLRTVQKLAGHSTVTVTERYAHLAPEYLQKAGTSISL